MSGEHYIGVGCVEAQWLPYAVLRHSIVKHARQPVLVEPLYKAGIEIPVPREEHNRQKTPFSFQRFLIPEARSYSGLAMYLDSDMLVFQDITRLFQQPFAQSNVLAVPNETSVMVLDCEHLDWNIRQIVSDLDQGKLSYDGLMTCRSVAKVGYSLSQGWNWLDNSPSSMPSKVALLHYTVTSSQPWLSSGHPYGHLWLNELFEALDDGSIQRSEVEESVKRRVVRPSLLYQIDNRLTKKAEIPKDVLKEDEPFAEYCRSVRYSISKTAADK